MSEILVRGAGIAGLTVAYAVASRGAAVRLIECRDGLAGCASWYAGGMLAPYCERESAEEIIQRRGIQAVDWWDEALPGHVVRAGTLVVAPPRDRTELVRFADRTEAHSRVDADEIGALEPDLGTSFPAGLFYPGEAHLEPRKAMSALLQKLQDLNVSIEFGVDPEMKIACEFEIDCRGMGAVLDGPSPNAMRMEPGTGLRGVRGDMLILRAPDISLTRTVRLLHPRIPLYIVPWADHHFMVGATMIESDGEGAVTARSMMELLNAAYSVNPSFGEAEVIEAGVGVRPAYADNVPRLLKVANGFAVNGLYRHGFLLAPILAEAMADWALENTLDQDFIHETDR